MIATALAAALIGQTREAPETSLVYTGMPVVVGSGMVMDWHTVVMTFGPETVKVESTTRFRDTSTSKEDTNAQIRVPLSTSGWATTQGTGISATWNGQAIKASKTDKGSPIMTKPGVANLGKPFVNTSPTPPRLDSLVPHTTSWTTYDVTFGQWSRQRTFKRTITLPLQVLGLDGVERQVAYSTSATGNPLSNFSMALKYSPQLVFSVTEQTPKSWPWQVGPEGAFVERKNATMAEGVASFRWYRGGFAPIGSTGGGQ